MNLLNHPVHASSTKLFTPRNAGVCFIVNTRSEKGPPHEAVMPTADEVVRHRSIKAPNGSAPNNSSLAGMELLVPKLVTISSKAGVLEGGDGRKE